MIWYNSDIHPCERYKQLRVLMYHKDWSTYIDGLCDRIGPDVKWFCYDPIDDCFRKWPEPEMWMEVKLPKKE